jgi:hypothetical protein
MQLTNRAVIGHTLIRVVQLKELCNARLSRRFKARTGMQSRKIEEELEAESS